MSEQPESTDVVKFDPDVGPKHPVNTDAARRMGLVYSEQRQAYVDAEGSLVLDRFGQPF